MCGIAGFLGRFDAPLLARMRHRITHRGPDGQGQCLMEEGRVGFAHTRLAIIDLSDAGLQPMWDSTRRICITYNGEIYNYRELRKDLIGKGEQFKSDSDTEVILALYRREGLAMLEKLKGMFAFALWDTEAKQALLARDGFGVKPMYLAEAPEGLLFASEIKALLEHRGLSRDIDIAAIRDYLTYLYCPGEMTPFRSVRKLLPGEACLISVKGEIVRRWRFYDIPTSLQAPVLSESQALVRVEEAFETAVKRQMVSDAPVGAFLSGGLDSSAIVSVARMHSAEQPMTCYTIRSSADQDAGEGRVSDLPYARRVAKHLGVKLEEVEVSTSILDDLDKMVYHLDEPFGDVASLNVYKIAKAARAQGKKVLLSGTGGDEVFAGYRRHVALANERFWAWMPRPLRVGLAAVARSLPSGPVLTRRIRKALSNADLSAEDRLTAYARWVTPEMSLGLFHPDHRLPLAEKHVGSGMEASLAGSGNERSALGQMLYLDANHFLADFNHIYSDKMSMAAGIEVRVPFCDPDLARFAAQLPENLKVRNRTSKYALKKIMEDRLPKDVIYRAKSGFGVPMRKWVRSELSARIEDRLSPQKVKARGLMDPAAVSEMLHLNKSGKADLGYPIFALMVIEEWCRTFIDNWSPIPDEQLVECRER
jgi:asparagine synthase (glutamine-hydrolysing)